MATPSTIETVLLVGAAFEAGQAIGRGQGSERMRAVTPWCAICNGKARVRAEMQGPARVTAERLEPEPRSGRQERLENLWNRYI